MVVCRVMRRMCCSYRQNVINFVYCNGIQKQMSLSPGTDHWVLVYSTFWGQFFDRRNFESSSYTVGAQTCFVSSIFWQTVYGVRAMGDVSDRIGRPTDNGQVVPVCPLPRQKSILHNGTRNHNILLHVWTRLESLIPSAGSLDFISMMDCLR